MYPVIFFFKWLRGVRNPKLKSDISISGVKLLKNTVIGSVKKLRYMRSVLKFKSILFHGAATE